MQEIDNIWSKYEDGGLLQDAHTVDDINKLTLNFARDVARTYRHITLLRRPFPNPAKYYLPDAPILGLLVRIAKLLSLSCRFYELNNGDHLSVFSRPMIESAIIATFLQQKGDEAVTDFRRCSYKDTLRILREHEGGSPFFDTPSGKSVLQGAYDDLTLEGLSKEDFTEQKRNGWRVQGNSLFDIFCDVVGIDEFPFIYGLLSESTHGSWNESMDWNLSRNEDNTFSTCENFAGVEARAILPLVRYSTHPFALWLERIQLHEGAVSKSLDRIQDFARDLFIKFDQLYDPSQSGTDCQAHLGEDSEECDPMDEIQAILSKYKHQYIAELLAFTPESDRMALTFYKDFSTILGIVSRLKNFERNPSGFSFEDAPILGLLVHIWKLLQLMIWIFEEDSAEHAAIAERSLMEVAVTATYLLRASDSTLEDYRRCSYKNRLKIIEQSASGAPYFQSKSGQRLLRSIREKLKLEGLNDNSFAKQAANRWRLDGRTFDKIFEDVLGSGLYPVSYGATSASVHGTWLEVLGFSLKGDVSGGFSPLYVPLRVNIGHVSTALIFAILPIREWLERVQLDERYLIEALEFMEKLNFKLFDKYGRLFYGF